MIWLIYNIALWFTAIFWIPWMVMRAKRRTSKVNWRERMGDIRIKLRPDSKRLWFHAVSVGEVIASLPILKEVRQTCPDCEIILSVTTSSGFETAHEKASEFVDHIIYFPIDVPKFVLNALITIRPTVIAIMETELWLNFMTVAHNFEIPTMIINGRISDRSFRRSKLIRPYYRAILRNVDQVLVQTKVDQERFQAYGALNAEVLGNSKFDQAAESVADKSALREAFGVKPEDTVLVIGSTRGEEEEAFVMEALSGRAFELYSKIIHAPRHIERAKELGSKIEDKWGEVGYRSDGDKTQKYIILDTYGELSQVYAIADTVIIGGGFADLGGQNILQPLAHGKPVLHGVHMHNFRDVTEAALAAGASLACSTPTELEKALIELHSKSGQSKNRSMGVAAKKLIADNLGASKRYADRILAALNLES